MGEKDIHSHSAAAAADLSAKQFYAVTLDTNGKWALATAGAEAIAILQEKTAITVFGKGMLLGHSLAVLGGTVTAGDKLASDANGKLVTALPGDAVVARALESGVLNDQKTVLLTGCSRAGSSGKVIGFVFDLADVANGNIVTGFAPGFRGTIKKLTATVLKAVTTAAKLATINPEIDAVDCTGGVLALTSANMTPIGAHVASSAVTALGTFGPTSVIDLEASAVTTFIEGRALIAIHVE